MDSLVLYKTIDFTAAPRKSFSERNAIWCKLYEDGKSSQEIADLYEVTRERVCQILRAANLIEHKAQRRRLAAELLEQDKAIVRSERDRKEEQIVQFVRSGDSIATAAAKVGLSVPVAIWACKKRGVESCWGRWRDYSARKQRLTNLVDAGTSLNAAMKQVGQEEGKKLSYVWVQRHCPSLIKKNQNKTPQTATVPVLGKATETSIWTEERIGRLIELWFGGASSQQVADIFGDCTRNAIIGQVHRLRVAGKLRMPA